MPQKKAPAKGFVPSTQFSQDGFSAYALTETSQQFSQFDYARVQSLSHVFSDFQMWKFVPAQYWANTLLFVNGKSPLQLSLYSGVSLALGTETAQFSLFSWSAGGAQIYNELQINIVTSVEAAKANSLQMLNNEFDLIRTLDVFSDQPADPAKAVFSFFNVSISNFADVNFLFVSLYLLFMSSKSPFASFVLIRTLL